MAKSKDGVHADEIVRVSVHHRGKKTSVSMDAFLANAMMRYLGGDLPVLREWVARRVDLLESQWQEKAAEGAPGERVRVKSGISRLVQREILREMLENPAGKKTARKTAAVKVPA